MKRKLLLLLLCIMSTFCAVAQDAYTIPKELSDNPKVSKIETMENLANKDYLELSGLITKLKNDIEMQTNLKSANINLKVKFSEFRKEYEDTIKYADKKGRLVLLKSFDDAFEQLSVNERTATKNIEKLKADLQSVETAINDLVSNQHEVQKFRQMTSVIFAILIGLVILGFFFAVFKNSDPDTIKTLLGEGGLQFITLFSIIISIVLFGVLQLMTGSELATILSGISGFILGGKVNNALTGSGDTGKKSKKSNMATKTEITTKVKSEIADIANYAKEIKDEYVLKDTPLSMDDEQLATLAIELTVFIREEGSTKSIKKSQLTKADLIVTDVINLVNPILNP